MIKKENFEKACKEIFEIMKHINESDKKLISHEFTEMIESQMDKWHSFEYDETKSIEQQSILRETRALLAYIYINFMGTKDEKAFYESKFKTDINNLNEILKEEQVHFTVFDKPRKEDKNNKIVEYKKASIIGSYFSKLKNWIKKIIKR